jgi:hypothetical protein
MVDTAFTYQFTSATKKQYLLGVACVYFSWLLFPLVFLFGYYIEVLASVSTGEQTLPDPSDPVLLVKNAVYGVITTFTYGGFLLAAPMFAVAAVGTQLSHGTTLSGTDFLNRFAMIAILFTAIFALILPVVLCLYGRNKRFRDIYDVEELFTIVATEEVIKAMLSTITLTTFVLIGVGVFTTLTQGLILLIAPFVLLWYMLATAFFYGRAINDVIETGDSEESIV